MKKKNKKIFKKDLTETGKDAIIKSPKRERQNKTMTKKMTKKMEEMLTDIIRKYGFEHSNTVYFAEVMENTDKAWKYDYLCKLHACMMNGIVY